MIRLFVCRICGEPYIGEEASDCPFCGAPKNYMRTAGEFMPVWGIELNEKEKENVKATLELEINAAAFYEKVAKAEKKYTKYNRLFKQLTRVEKEHAEIASKLLKIELPELKGEDAKGIEQDLKRTRELEQEAVKKYQRFLQEAENLRLKNFFVALIHAEAGHDKIVSREMN